MAYYEDVVEVNGKIKCILCEINISEDNIDLHINSNQHIEMYVKRLMTCNNIIQRQEKAYCLVCNKFLCNLEDHIHSASHQHNINEIKNIVEKDGDFLELPKNVTKNAFSIYCMICDINVNFSIIEIKEHISSIKHRRARAMAVQPHNGIFSVEGTEGYLWCKICRLYFENYIEVIFQHVDENNEHVTTRNKILRLIKDQNITIEKYLTNPNEDKATCNKCGIEVSCNVDNLERHVKGKKHKNA